MIARTMRALIKDFIVINLKVSNFYRIWRAVRPDCPPSGKFSRTGLLFRVILPVIPDVFLKFFRRNDLEVTDFPVLFGSAE